MIYIHICREPSRPPQEGRPGHAPALQALPAEVL